MKQHSSAVKAHKQTLKKRLRNKSIKTKIRTYIKKVEDQLLLRDFTEAKASLSLAESIIMRAVTKKVLKLNTASRKVSKLAHRLKSIDNISQSSL